MIVSRVGGKPGIIGQSGPRATQQGAATPGQGESSAAGNVAESQLFLGVHPTNDTRQLELYS